jgi:hypothetical protein
MAATYDVNGIHIVLNKVTHIGRIRNYSPADFVVAPGVPTMPKFFGLPVHLSGQNEPLFLTDIDREILSRIKWDLLSAIEDRDNEKADK